MLDILHLKENTAVFVCRHAGSAQDIEAGHVHARLCSPWDGEPLSFVYLPEIVPMLSQDALRYLSPGTGEIRVQDFYDELYEYFHKNFGFHDWGFVVMRKDGFGLRFIPGERYIPEEEDVRWMLQELRTPEGEIDLVCGNVATDLPPAPAPVLDSKAEEIMREIREVAQRHNLSEEEIFEIFDLMGRSVKPGPMRITSGGRIFLTEYGNVEVKLDPLSKAVYFLYLRHPEGIAFKELYQFKDELKEIYLELCNKSDISGVDKSIDDLVDPFNNGINVKVSRIKGAFLSVVCDRIARFYYIDGEPGSAKRVELDRGLVRWG